MTNTPTIRLATPERNILAIPGSLRRESLNRRLLHAVAARPPKGIGVQLYTELGSLPPFDEDEEAAALAAGPVRRLHDQVAAANGLLIATPEYNHSIPGVLKNAIDWLSRPSPDAVLAGKPIALIGASAGRWGTRLAQAALRQTLFATESVVLTGPALYLSGADAAFGADGSLTDLAAFASLQEIMRALGELIDVRSARASAREVQVAAEL